MSSSACSPQHPDPRSLPHTTPSATSIREYVPGDAYNRIHWKTSARQGELLVKEFELEQTADVLIFLDLHAPDHTGSGDDSTLEYGVRISEVVHNVQSAVKFAIEQTLSMKVGAVNVYVQWLHFSDEGE